MRTPHPADPDYRAAIQAATDLLRDPLLDATFARLLPQDHEAREQDLPALAAAITLEAETDMEIATHVETVCAAIHLDRTKRNALTPRRPYSALPESTKKPLRFKATAALARAAATHPSRQLSLLNLSDLAELDYAPADPGAR